MSDLHLEAALKAIDSASSICRDGKADVKRILKTLVNGLEKEEKTYRVGQKFRVYGKYAERKVMLSRCNVDGRMCLVVVDGHDAGHQLTGTLHINNRSTVTRDELNSLFFSSLYEIEPIEDDS